MIAEIFYRGTVNYEMSAYRPELEQTGYLPYAKTTKEWIITDFHRFRDNAVEVLADEVIRCHISHYHSI